MNQYPDFDQKLYDDLRRGKDRMLAERNAQVEVVLGLEVEEEELIDRLLKRGQVSGRSDDNMGLPSDTAPPGC